MDGSKSLPLRSSSTVGTAAALICVAAFAISVGSTQTGVVMISIERMDTGKAPAEFQSARTGQGSLGRWTVVADPTATRSRAIEQSSTDPTDYRFPLAIYQPLSLRNGQASVRFKPIGGQVDRAGGIAIRLIDADNYYVVRANALEDNVRFYRVVKGERVQIEGANLKVSSDEWHVLAVRANDDQFAVSFDGRELYTATDRTFDGPGKFALWTKADSVTRFDDIKISAQP